MIDREGAHRLLDPLMDAMEQEQAANSDEARAAAQTVVLAADAALARANGTTNDTRAHVGMATVAPGVHVPLDSPRAEHALVQAWTDAKEKPLLPPVNTVTRVIKYLQAQAAREKTPKAESAVRVARGKSGAVLIDRGTKDHSAYCVTAAGVGVVDATTVEREGVRFIRLPLADPFAEVDLSASITDAVAGLRRLFKFMFDEDAWVLAGPILAAWIPDVAYSVICIVGPHGSGKSSLTRNSRTSSIPRTARLKAPRGRRQKMSSFSRPSAIRSRSTTWTRC